MAFIVVGDLPTALQSAEMIETMLAGANSRAARVAPCLVEPTSTVWAATTAYAVDELARLAAGEYVKVTTAGTSGATIPAVPALIGGTVVDGTATWTRIAPTLDHLAEARLVLLGAVKRWAEAGSGALQAQQAGPFGVTLDTRQRTGFNLWPSEITGLQDICKTVGVSGREVFSLDTASTCGAHLPWCSLMLGALYCSCGADIAGYPIYEMD